MTPGSWLTVLGYGVGALVFWLAARRRGVATDGFLWIALAGITAGAIGARLAEWIAADAGMRWDLLDPRVGGRTIVGGILAGWLGVEIAKRRLGVRRSTGDLFALALAAGEAVGRLGCFLNGCCYGIASTVPWAVYQHGAWRHPAQLYAAFAAAGIFAVLAWMPAPREGDRFRAYLMLYGGSRFCVESFREHGAGAAGVQWACLAMLGAGALWWIESRRLALQEG